MGEYPAGPQCSYQPSETLHREGIVNWCRVAKLNDADTLLHQTEFMENFSQLIFSFDLFNCADISLCLCSTYSILRGAAINLITYSKVNQPTNTASAISKKYSSSRKKIMHNEIVHFSLLICTNLRMTPFLSFF